MTSLFKAGILLSSAGVFGAGYGIGTTVFKAEKENKNDVIKPKTIRSGGKIEESGNKLSIGTISALNTDEVQWQFLHKLGTKVFEYLKRNNKADNKKDFIEWFKSKLAKKESSNLTEDWKKFRDLCFKALEDEDSAKYAEIQTKSEVRLCFMGDKSIHSRINADNNFAKMALDSAIHKGRLFKWTTDKDSLYKDLDIFGNNKWSDKISNYDLYDDFWSKLSDSLRNEYYNSTDSSSYSFDEFWKEWVGEGENDHQGQWGKKLKSWLE